MVLKYTKLLDNITGECIAIDKDIQGFEYQDATLSPFDKKWYITSYLADNEAYQRKFFDLKKTEKYQEITDAYDKACNYGLAPVTLPSGEEYLANRAWLSTWDEAITGLIYKSSISGTPATTFVRLYKKYGDFMYKNYTVEDITAEMYQALKLQLIDYRFNTLQANRNELYARLEKAETLEDIENIKVNFGETLNEQTETDKIILNEPDSATQPVNEVKPETDEEQSETLD